jgi:regulator of nucleoside diphosphate kinase
MKDIVDISERPGIIVSEMDQRRLTDLGTAAFEDTPAVARELIIEMERARVVPTQSVPPNTVQMGSTVRFRSDDGHERTVTLVFPGLADIAEGRISILTPIGAALIGLSEGQSIAWATRDGRERRLTVLEVKTAKVEAATPL